MKLCEMKGLPWYYRVDELLHHTFDRLLGRHPGLWRLAYTGPRKWFCDYADSRMQRHQLVRTSEIANSICIKGLSYTTSSSNATMTVVQCWCSKCRKEQA